MAKLSIVKGATSQIVEIFVQDSTKAYAAGLTGLAYNTSSLVAYYARPDQGNAGATAISLATATRGTYTSGGFVEKDSTNAPGVYELGLPTGVLATGARSVVVTLQGATNMAQTILEIELTGVDNQDAVHGGMSALPNAAAAATGGLPTLGSSTGQINPSGGKVPATLASTDVTGNVASDLQTIKTQAVTCAAAVTVYPAVGSANELAVDASGRVDIGKFLGTASAGTAGYVGIDWAHINAPTTTVNLSGTTVSALSGTVTLADASLTTAKLGTFVLAKTTNISGFNDIAATSIVSSGAINTSSGAVTTVTNLVNAATAGDLTATMKTSVAASTWNAVAASYDTGGTMGQLLNAISDPMAVTVPGSYAAGTAGYVIGNLPMQADITGGNYALHTDSSGNVQANAIQWDGVATAVGSSSQLPKVDMEAINDSTTKAGYFQTMIGNGTLSAAFTGNLTGNVNGKVIGGGATSITGIGVNANATQLLGATIPQANAGQVAANFGFFYDVSPTTTNTVNSVEGVDPLGVSVPGSYGAGTVGYLIGNNLDTNVGSRGTSTLTQSQVTGGDYALQTDGSGYVKLSAGTGTGQLSFTSGVVKSNLAQILGTALTETSGYLAAAFKQFFNIASPTSTMNLITGVTTATNLTNAATSGDFTATMKTSLGTAVGTPQTGDSFALIGTAGAGLTSLGDTRLANLDAAVSTRLAPGGTLAAVTTAVHLTNAPTNGDLTAAMKSSVASSILSQPNNLLATNSDGTVNVTDIGTNVTVGGYATGQDPATLLLANPTHLIYTDASGFIGVSSGTGSGQVSLSSGAVIVQSGTGTGQLSITSGVVKASLVQILGTALTETSGYLAAAFKQFFNIASPSSTMNTITTVTNLTNAATNGDLTSAMKTSVTTAASAATPEATIADGAISSTTFANNAISANSIASAAVTKIQTGLATPTNITAGTITTVTNVTNSPTNGDFTATQKASITTAATAATPTAAAVTGNVGGNVVGSVGAVPGTVATASAVAAVKAQTDKMQFDNSNNILASAQGAGDSIVLGPIAKVTATSTEQASPIVVFQGEAKNLVFAVVTTAGIPVNLSTDLVRFIAYQPGTPPVDFISYDTNSGHVVVSGIAGNIVTVSLTTGDTGTAQSAAYVLRDITTANVLAQGSFDIQPAPST